ncbi:MAG TPA: CAP domain-containing protein [bacterium]|nr:CAP domain-containing protein [bacterium]
MLNLLRKGTRRAGAFFLFASVAIACILAASALTRAAVQRYGDKVQVGLTDEESAALETLGELLKMEDGKPLTVDPNLVEAARALARQYQNNTADVNSTLSTQNRTKVMGEHGIYENSLRCIPLFFSTSDDIRSQLKLREKSGTVRYTQVGAGAAMPRGMKYGVMVIVLADKRTELSPFPRQVNLPSSWTLRGKLANSCRGSKAKVLLTSPGGKVQSIEAKMNGDSFSATIPFNQGAGTYHLEVEAVGSGTAKIAALMEVTAGGAGGSSSSTFEVSGFDRVPGDEAEAEDMMLEMINQVRFKEGLEAVSDDPHLKELARAQSRDMKERQYVGHLSPEFGTLSDRVQAAGLSGYAIKENVALDNDLAQAMNNLLKSPAHRAVIIDPDVNTVGVGIAFSGQGNDRQYYVSQEFAKIY